MGFISCRSYGWDEVAAVSVSEPYITGYCVHMKSGDLFTLPF